jgi:hypothetical protein
MLVQLLLHRHARRGTLWSNVPINHHRAREGCIVVFHARARLRSHTVRYAMVGCLDGLVAMRICQTVVGP